MRSRYLIAALLLVVTGFPRLLMASQIQISPVKLEFSADTRVQQLRLGNPGDNAMVLQLELFAWDQADNANSLTPDRDFLATPPIVEIPAHSRKIVRIGPRKPPEGACEIPYRVIVTEIPPQTGPHERPVRFRSQVSLPLFARTQASCHDQIAWQRNGNNVVISNQGDGHTQIHAAWVQSDQQRWDLTIPDVGYVLAGRQRSLALPNDVPTQALTLHLKLANQELSGPLVP